MNRDKKAIYIFLLFIVLLVIMLGTGSSIMATSNETQQKKIIRVGFPIQDGLTEIDSKNNLTGYTYEYLQEISQYTGWEYEFVQLPGAINDVLTQMLGMLEKGELDLMGGMVYDEKYVSMYEYPTYSYGMTYSNISVLEENTEITESNFQTLDTIRIAVLESYNLSSLESLKQFCNISGVNLELVKCKDKKDLYDSLSDGRADAITSSDFDYRDWLRVVARYEPKPYYFAATKGNKELTSALNNAIMSINEADPYYSSKLYSKYIDNVVLKLAFNQEEKKYIKENPVLRVAVMNNRAPIQYFSSKKDEYAGISVDFVKYLSKETGLSIEWVPVADYEELKEVLKEGKADIIAGVPYDYKLSKIFDISLTRPYTSSQIVMIVGSNTNLDDLEDKKMALPKSFSYLDFDYNNAYWYSDEAECIQAVINGDVDYSFGNGYIVQSDAMIFSSYQDISIIPQPSDSQEICVGVARPINSKLLAIINKVALSVDEEEMRSIVYHNVISLGDEISFSEFIDANPREVLIIVSLFALFVIGLMAVIFYVKIKSASQLQLESERYQQLCSLSNESLFEYNYNSDIIYFSGQNLGFLGTERIIKHFSKFMVDYVKEYTDSALQSIWAQILSKENSTSESFCKLTDQSCHWLRFTSSVIRGIDSLPIYSIGKVTDIQKEKEETAILKKQAQRDSLTGIYNAATVRKITSKALSETTADAKNVFLIIDVDKFKSVNDHYGHYTGDQVLIATAEILQYTFRKTDIIGRIGGDEFVVFMRNVGTKENVAEKCRILLKEVNRVNLERHNIPVTLSIGVALAQEEQDYNTLYQIADEALYSVKNRGRGNFIIVPEEFVT